MAQWAPPLARWGRRGACAWSGSPIRPRGVCISQSQFVDAPPERRAARRLHHGAPAFVGRTGTRARHGCRAMRLHDAMATAGAVDGRGGSTSLSVASPPRGRSPCVDVTTMRPPRTRSAARASASVALVSPWGRVGSAVGGWLRRPMWESVGPGRLLAATDRRWQDVAGGYRRRRYARRLGAITSCGQFSVGGVSGCEVVEFLMERNG